jgi:transcriptional regulator with XRE-family HTH domain
MTTKELVRVAEMRRRFESGEAKMLRVTAGLTLSEAAQAAGVSSVSLWRYENGKRSPRGPEALAYARFLEQLERGLSR